MGQIKIENLDGKSIDYKGNSKRLLDVLLEHTDWMHSCGGKGRCTTCKAIVLNASEQLPEMNEFEKRFASLGKLKENERLSCQLIYKEDMHLSIKVADRNKLPHLVYSD